MVDKSMIRLRSGSKLKVKKSFPFYDQTIHQTKEGFVWTGYLYGRPEKEIFTSLFEAKEALLLVMKTENTKFATYAFRLKHCMPISEAFYERKLWNHEGADDEPIRWGTDGGKAVAVRLDSMGTAVEFLSLHDWSNIHDWKLPDEGDWHYFKSTVR